MVIDADHTNTASKIAAGIINPITGHRWNLSNNFYEFLKVAKSFYTEIEETLNCQLLTPITQTRLIKNKGQFDYFKKRLQQDEYEGLLTELDRSLLKSTGYEFANVAHTYHFDTQCLLKKISNWLYQQASLRHEVFNYNNLDFDDNGVNYRSDVGESISAHNIIFCEGHRAIHNPWLKDLPFKLAKGSVLEVSLKKSAQKETIQLDPTLLNWGHWLLSDKQGKTRLGSSYEWNDISTQASLENQQMLLTSMHQNTLFRGTASAHKTGVRPTTKYRQPFVGAITTLKHAYCFNGLGSKGCLIAPHYVDMLFQHFTDGSPIKDELKQWL